MKAVAQPCSAMISSCTWKTKNYNCSKLFHLMKTTTGYCCAFNYYASTQFQKDLKNEDKERFYTSSAGKDFGLILNVNAEEEQYLSSLRKYVGVYVEILDGYNIPSPLLKGQIVQPGEVANFEVSVNIFSAEKNVIHLTPHQRQCYYKWEGLLKETKIYSYNTCLNECKTDAMFKYCNCVPFYRAEMKDRRYCSFKDSRCLIKNATKYGNIVLNNFDSDESKMRLRRRVSQEAVYCDCLPTCEEISYKVKYIKSKSKIMRKSQMSTVKIYFGSWAAVRSIKIVTVSWDFVLSWRDILILHEFFSGYFI